MKKKAKKSKPKFTRAAKPKAKPKAVNTFKIQPLGDRVIVKPFSEGEGEQTKAGIFIPETVKKEKSEEGRVVAVGEGKYIDGRLVPLNVKVGDKVMFSKYGFDEVKIDGEEYFILKEDSILAVIN